TTADIAKALFVSRSTAKLHLRNAYRKLGARNRAAAIAAMAARGILPAPDIWSASRSGSSTTLARSFHEAPERTVSAALAESANL
ncbi:MAG: Bacterial regulatory protein luxR family, partial [Solirubrobacteraceae bacterium]|nr:Bacterial regulatory protein luxR family [Solirubrobacteraceae bacterium]